MDLEGYTRYRECTGAVVVVPRASAAALPWQQMLGACGSIAMATGLWGIQGRHGRGWELDAVMWPW